MRILALAALAALTPSPADACRGCKPPTEAQLVSGAAYVVAGKVTAVGKDQITFEVDTVWKGSVAKTFTRSTQCWVALKKETRLILIDRYNRFLKWNDDCLGIQRDTPAARERITKLAGAPQAP